VRRQFNYKIIGLVGPIACGKGIIVDYLINKYEYTSFSLSSLLHDELKRLGITQFTRTTLQDMGDELRKKEGDDVLARRAIESLKVSKSQSLKVRKVIIEGIRNPGEVEYLRIIPGFYLIAVDASPQIRFQRVLKRGKTWDPKDLKSFQKIDKRDSKDKNNANGQQVRMCIGMADILIENNKDMNSVYSIIDSLMEKSSLD
jgi:dephospho-CoA kinase